MVKFENREIWADLENRSKVVHSENFPIWRPASGHRDHVTHHVTSHVTHWGQWKYASRSWHAVGNHRRQLKLMYRSKISGRGLKHCSGSKFQCRPRPVQTMSSSVLRPLLLPSARNQKVCDRVDTGRGPFTWPYHLSRQQRRTDVISSMPSFCCTD